MKSAPLVIKSIYLISKKDINSNWSKTELTNFALQQKEIYFTPGSAQLQSTQKNSAGNFWEHDIAYSFPGIITEDQEKQVNETGAVIAETLEGKTAVFYQNVYLSNSKLRPEIISGQQKTSVKFAITTLYIL